MTAARANPLLNAMHSLWEAGSLAGRSDRELIARFLEGGGPVAEAAFTAMVLRHGPLVLRVCRELLGDHHAVEDAFQATFLVLARKARTVRHPELLNRWLHGVAVRAARKARSADARRARPLGRAGAGEPAAADGPIDRDLIRREAAELLHQELGRLPEKYRAPVVLCHLEGLTHEEAARRLGWPSGTVSVRLMRARELLRHRLTRRGVAPAVAVGVALSAEASPAAVVPAGLIEATTRAVMQAVIGSAGAPAAALTEGVLRGLSLARLRAVAALLAAIVLGGAIGAAAAHRISQGPEDELEARALALALASPYTPGVRPPPAPIPSRQRPPDINPHEPAPGYEWVIIRNYLQPASGSERVIQGKDQTPRQWRQAFARVSSSLRDPQYLGACYLDQDETGDTIITLCHAVEPGCERILDWRPVLFDERNRRYLPVPERSTRATSEFGDRIAIDRFRLGRDVLAFEAIAGDGLERMKPETRLRAEADPGAPAIRFTWPASDSAPHDREPSPGCAWALAPRPVGRGDWTAAVAGPGGGVACDVSTNLAGGLIIHLAYRSLTLVDVTGEPVEEYRPVLFDAAGRRRVLKAKVPGEWQPMLLLWPRSEGLGLAGSSNDAGIFRFEVPPGDWPGPSPDPHAALIGVERLAPSTLRAARVASFLATMRRLERAKYTGVAIEDFWDPYSWATCPHVGIVWPSGLLREPLVGRDPPANPEFRRGAWLGAFEVLRRDRGGAGAAPKALRDAQIARFVRLMAEFERAYGPLVPRRVETPLLDAYEILRRRAARSPRRDPDLEAARNGVDY